MDKNDQKQFNKFSKQVDDKVKRKLQAKKEHSSVWLGLGMFGLIGWSIVAPTLAGAAVGIWLDKSYPETFSWTLSLLIVGLLSGCLLAWQWVEKEHQDINNEDNE